MADERAERRLAAILAADVVGYTRLMEADEEGTLARVTRLFAGSVKPAVAAHRGRVVKTMGDGFLAEFPSVVDAVNCAAEIQHGSTEGDLMLRMGINLGDVIHRDGDVFGDGVNVAARLEALAEPGAVYISGSTFEQVAGKTRFGFADLGEQSLKNVGRPIRVYRLAPADTRPAARPARGRKRPWALAAGIAVLVGVGAAAIMLEPFAPATETVSSEEAAEASIAVLPFANRSDTGGQAYFADGITDDIMTDLTKVPGLLVISRDTTFNYRRKNPDIRALGRELNVRYVLQGSVRREGSRVRINAALTDASDGRHVWGERYDGTLDDVFRLQDAIARQIAAALSLKLHPTHTPRNDTADVTAYELFLRGRDRFFRFSRQETYLAREFLEQALARDPRFARAQAVLAWTYAFEYTNGWSSAPKATLEHAMALADKAVALNARLPLGYFVRGLVLRESRDFAKAAEEARHAIAIDPNYAPEYVLLATVTRASPRKGWR